jgi:hypothetical protein
MKYVAGWRISPDQGQLSGSVNGTSATVNASEAGPAVSDEINANGNVTNTPLAFHQRAVFCRILIRALCRCC